MEIKNKINPIRLSSPSAINAMNIMPKARKGEATADVPPLLMFDEIELMKEKIRTP